MEALIFDTETSGLLQSALIPLDSQPEVIEIYAARVDLDTGEIMDEYETLIKPRLKFSEASKRVTHMDESTLERAPYFASVAQMIRAIVEEGPFVIAHNASFDVEMLNVEFARLDQKIQWPRVLCSVEQTVNLYGYRLSLSALHEKLFGEKFKDAHRAKSDTQALIRCCCELHKRGVI